jgi:hypothetical protein
MASRIFACGGTIKKYIGNAIFARECQSSRSQALLKGEQPVQSAYVSM